MYFCLGPQMAMIPCLTCRSDESPALFFFLSFLFYISKNAEYLGYKPVIVPTPRLMIFSIKWRATTGCTRLFASRPPNQERHQTEIFTHTLRTPCAQKPTPGGARWARQVCQASKQTDPIWLVQSNGISYLIKMSKLTIYHFAKNVQLTIYHRVYHQPKVVREYIYTLAFQMGVQAKKITD
jgi:hypothetical protein